MSTIDRRDLFAWCRIPCEELEHHHDLRVPFRLVRDSAAMGELMAAELVEAIEEANARGLAVLRSLAKELPAGASPALRAILDV